MLKISEFARLAKTTRRTLIFYDEKGLFSPAKIAENGYRFYEPDQLYQFEMISGLRQLGLSLEEIKSILDSNGDQLAEYLTQYQEKIQENIRQLQLLDRLLDMHKQQTFPYKDMVENEVQILSSVEQAFWCTDLEVDCTPEDVARLYAAFLSDLGDINSKLPGQLGFLTELALDNGQEYMTAAFRFIKEVSMTRSRHTIPIITKSAGRYLSIKVQTSLEGILNGLTQLREYADKHQLELEDFLWQINTDQQLIKNGSSAEQVLQYRILQEGK
ncbi:MerR family transcriptional regulator [Streptococcus merionis]|uniref:MerR family transcriptional regulator n=1 Tax=Streptococcus merionis TaxID=400065 RepID=A0A239ST02_9STRE|nr:MerR family transcriptional regulator [Streptococcus merionis]SNU87968.1 MerR family transcriptional regulator [Streptococcus merionis]